MSLRDRAIETHLATVARIEIERRNLNRAANVQMIFHACDWVQATFGEDPQEVQAPSENEEMRSVYMIVDGMLLHVGRRRFFESPPRSDPAVMAAKVLIKHSPENTYVYYRWGFSEPITSLASLGRVIRNVDVGTLDVDLAFQELTHDR